MTSDPNFATVKRIEKETAKKEKIKKEKERISNETLAKFNKEQAIKIRKIKRKVVKKIKSYPKKKLCRLKPFPTCTARSVKMSNNALRNSGRKPCRFGTT